jgi:hypothetical protein
MPNNNNTLNKISSIFKNYSIGKEQKQHSFIDKLKIRDTKTDKILNIKYSLENKIRNDYLFKIFTSVYIQNWVTSQSSDYQGVFITLTLPSKFHNLDNLDNLDIIKEGYEQLNNTFRYIYHNFKIDDKKVPIKFIRVIEPHKSFIPHLHALLFVKLEDVEKFKKHLNNVLDPINLICIGNTKFKSNYSYNKNIGRFEYELIDNINKCSGYLLKYIGKSIGCNNEDLDYYHLMNGWKTYNKIRNFTYSRGLAIPRYIFDKVSKVLKLKIGKDYEEGDNILKVVEEIIDIYQVIFDSENNIKKSERISYKSLYNICIVKEKIVKSKYKLINGIKEKVKTVYYKLREFQIIRKSDNLVIYDKNRFILV